MADRREGELAGRVALVTGSSSGIGAGTARALAREGANVVVTYHGNEDGAREVAKAVEDAGAQALVAQLDAAEEESVVALFDETIDRFGRIDIVVANAGAQKDAGFAEMTMEEWCAVIDLDLTGQFLAAREGVRRMRGQTPVEGVRARGAIVCVSSVHDVIPWAGHVNYTAAKAGVKMMMQSIAQEVAHEGIRVNAVSPGAIKTDINKDVWGDDERRARLLELIPYGRLGEVEDVARAIVWLASDASDYMTGQTLYVDGGMTLYPSFIGNG